MRPPTSVVRFRAVPRPSTSTMQYRRPDNGISRLDWARAGWLELAVCSLC